MQLTEIQSIAEKIQYNIAQVMVGQRETTHLLLVALFAGGHVLVEDLPGTGKTLLAKSLAKSIQGRFKRVQFTPDLLPSDLSGIQFFNQKQNEFEFRPGPLFTEILLADELNRATPRTQSSLLESMEERQVTVDGETHKLSLPFMVIATQNPIEQQGTFPLPEAQLDRFMLKLTMKGLSDEESVQMLLRFRVNQPLDGLAPVVDGATIARSLDSFQQVHVEADLCEYIVRCAEAIRSRAEVAIGISPRACLAMLKAAQVHAALQGRSYVLPDDIKELAEPLWSHRIVLKHALHLKGITPESVVRAVMDSVEVPAEKNIAKR